MDFESGTKGSILEIISSVPGIHLREIARRLGISLNTVRYHVRILANSGLISCSNEGSFTRLFPAGTPQDRKSVYSVLRSKTARKIIASLGKRSLTNKQICEATGFAKSTVSEHVQIMLQNKLVKIATNEYGSPEIRLINPDLARDIISESRFDLVQSYVDLWDF
jgi:predicted transcriptional regulator